MDDDDDDDDTATASSLHTCIDYCSIWYDLSCPTIRLLAMELWYSPCIAMNRRRDACRGPVIVAFGMMRLLILCLCTAPS